MKDENRIDGDLVSRQMRGVLYGMRSLIGRSATNRAPLYECLYFAESAFFRHRNRLDAAIVIDENDEIIFCLNDHSKNSGRVRECAIGEFFANKGVLYDQAAWEKLGFQIADCGMDRTDEQNVRQFVEQKYKLGETTVMSFQRHSAVAPVSKSR